MRAAEHRDVKMEPRQMLMALALPCLVPSLRQCRRAEVVRVTATLVAEEKGS